MPIYDLNDINFLEHDIENIFNVIDSIYEVTFKISGTEYYSKTLISNNNHWTSEACKTEFNRLIPITKGLLKDMYALLENLFKARTGTFDKVALENQYQYLKELRLINNKFKHFHDSVAEITLTEIVLMESKGHLIDIYCNYRYKDGSFEGLRLADLINVYIIILEDQKAITIERI